MATEEARLDQELAALHRRMGARQGNRRASRWQDGADINRFREQGLWRLRWPTWKAFLEQEFPESYGWLNTISKVAEMFTEEEVVEHGATRLGIVGNAPAQDRPELRMLLDGGASKRVLEQRASTLKASRCAARPPEAPSEFDRVWHEGQVTVPARAWVHERVSLVHGDVEQVLQLFPDNAFDGCLCDPPYGYAPQTKQEVIGESLTRVPSVSLWRQVYRVLFPGTLLIATTGESYDLTSQRIEEAGFTLWGRFLWIFDRGDARANIIKTFDPCVVAYKPPADGLDAGWSLDPEVVADDGFEGDEAGLDLSAVEEGRVTWTRERGDEAHDAEPGHGDEFFFCTNNNPRPSYITHPTLKPLALTEHLARLIRPPVERPHMLVPFSGVGSEIIGALNAGWDRVTGIELEADYLVQARRRIVDECPR